MRIESFIHPELHIVEQVRALESVCQAHDHIAGALFLDPSLNVSPEIPCLLALYEEDVLAGVMTLFAPSQEEVELVGLTHLDFRRRGVFRALISAAAGQARRFDIPDLLFVCQPQSRSGLAALSSFDARLEHVEYSLRFQRTFSLDSLAVPEGLVLERATEAELDAMARISAQSFAEEAEQALSFLKLAIHSDTRTQFLARLSGEPVAIGAIGIADGEATIYGIGVLPRLQGRGIGRGVIALLLQEIRQRGIKEVCIEVNSKNEAALHLYQSCGFVVASTYGYYRVPVVQLVQDRNCAQNFV